MEPETKKLKHNLTELHEAIINLIEYDDIIIIFSKNKEVAKVKDANGNYPLYLICRYRPLFLTDLLLQQFVVELIDCFPDALCQDCWNDCLYNPLHMAADVDDHQLVSRILDKNNCLLNTLDRHKRTPLQVACHSRSRKVVDLLLKFQGVKINNIDHRGETALFCVPEWRIVGKLLEYNDIDVGVRNNKGLSVFYLFLAFVNEKGYKYSERSKVFKVVMLFMSMPGALKWRNSDGHNILHTIVSWNNPEIMSVLLLLNHDLVSIQDKNGETPLHMACGQVGKSFVLDGRHDTYAYHSISKTGRHDSYLQCLNMLFSIVYDETLNKKNQLGKTALHLACRCGNRYAIQKLLQEQETDEYICDNEGYISLFDSILLADNSFKDMKTTGLTSRHRIWDLTNIQLLLDHNEFLILAKTKEGNTIVNYAHGRLRRICNVPIYNQKESLTTDFFKIIDELHEKMAKARWKMFQYMMNNIGLHK